MTTTRFIYTLLVILTFSLNSNRVTAQQLPVWSDFHSLQYTFNPSAITFGEWEDGNRLALDAVYRHQYTGYEGAPRTAMIGVQYNLPKLNTKFGGVISNDQFGPTSATQVQAQYAYQLHFDYSGEHILAFGIGLSATQFRLDGRKITTQTPGDQLLSESLEKKVVANGKLGVFYVNPIAQSRLKATYLFAGLSAEQALPSDVLFPGQADKAANLKRELHYNLTFGLRFEYNAGADYIEPALWGRMTTNVPVNVLFSTKMTFAEQSFWGGVALSSAWEASLLFGVRAFEGVDVGYAGSFFPSNIFSTRSGLSHEVRVSYIWKN